MILAFANVLFYLNYKNCALWCMQNRNHYITAVEAFKIVCVDVHKMIRKTQKIKLQMHQHVKKKEFDVLNDKEGVYLVSLVSSDQCRDHYVTIFGDYIFDSNENFVLDCYMNSLNRCCSSNENILKFVECDVIALFKLDKV